MPPLAPLRTGRETFASSGSSRTKAPRERSRFHNGFDPGFSAREAGLLVERTFREVGLPLRVKRIAQAALGHNSKAIHRAYAKKAQIIVPSLEEYETAAAGLQMAKAG